MAELPSIGDLVAGFVPEGPLRTALLLMAFAPPSRRLSTNIRVCFNFRARDQIRMAAF
jgi:hypothetical protein